MDCFPGFLPGGNSSTSPSWNSPSQARYSPGNSTPPSSYLCAIWYTPSSQATRNPAPEGDTTLPEPFPISSPAPQARIPAPATGPPREGRCRRPPPGAGKRNRDGVGAFDYQHSHEPARSIRDRRGCTLRSPVYSRRSPGCPALNQRLRRPQAVARRIQGDSAIRQVQRLSELQLHRFRPTQVVPSSNLVPRVSTGRRCRAVWSEWAGR